MYRRWIGQTVFVVLSPCLATIGFAGAAIAQQNESAVEGAASGEWRFAGPAFVALSVANLEESSAWYARVLGVEQFRAVEAPDGSARVRLLRRSDIVVELIAHAEPIDARVAYGGHPDFRFLGIFKSGLFVEGIEALHDELLSHGVQTDARIGVDEAVAARTFIFRDPDGNRLQVFELCGAAC